MLKTDPRFMTAPNLFCLRAARGERIEVRTLDHFGLIHVDDAVQALMDVGERRDATAYKVFNAVTDVVRLTNVADAVVAAAATHEVPVTVDQREFPGACRTTGAHRRMRLDRPRFCPQAASCRGSCRDLRPLPRTRAMISVRLNRMWIFG